MAEQYVCPLAKFSKHKTDDYHCNTVCGASIAVQARYEAAGIPEGYRNIYLDNSPAKDDQEDVYKALGAFINTFSKDDVQIKSLYLYSKSPGTGKTTTAIAVLAEFLRRRFLYHAKKGETIPEVLGLFCDINEMQTQYNLATMSNRDVELGRIRDDIERYSSAPMLVMDDVGVRSSTESFRAMVHSIINRRVTNNLPTIFTSNVLMEDLETVFDARLRDRIADQNITLAFKGSSKRGRRASK